MRMQRCTYYEAINISIGLYLEHEIYWSPLIICIEKVGFTKSCVFGFSVGAESLDVHEENE